MARDWTQEFFGINETTPVSNVESGLKKKLEIALEAFKKIELSRYDIADEDQEDWFKIATYMAEIAHKATEKIEEIK